MPLNDEDIIKSTMLESGFVGKSGGRGLKIYFKTSNAQLMILNAWSSTYFKFQNSWIECLLNRWLRVCWVKQFSWLSII